MAERVRFVNDLSFTLSESRPAGESKGTTAQIGMAERVGFEPTVPFRAHGISSAAS